MKGLRQSGISVSFTSLKNFPLSTITCVPNFVASNYQKVITDIWLIFFFVLYWFAPCLKFGPLPSENLRCAPAFFSRVPVLSVGIYMFKVNNRNTRTRLEICLKLVIKTPKRDQWRRSGIFIVSFKHISHLVLVFVLLTLNR